MERVYNIGDGRQMHVTVELDAWSAWISGDETTHVIGFPLVGVIAEVLGFDAVRHDPPAEVIELARRVQSDFPEFVDPGRRPGQAVQQAHAADGSSM